MSKNQVKFKISEEVHLPPDIIAGALLLTVQDNRYIQIENFKSILEYSENCLKIQGKNCRIKIEGERIQINYYTFDECSIKGVIRNISYEMIDT